MKHQIPKQITQITINNLNPSPQSLMTHTLRNPPKKTGGHPPHRVNNTKTLHPWIYKPRIGSTQTAQLHLSANNYS